MVRRRSSEIVQLLCKSFSSLFVHGKEAFAENSGESMQKSVLRTNSVQSPAGPSLPVFYPCPPLLEGKDRRGIYCRKEERGKRFMAQFLPLLGRERRHGDSRKMGGEERKRRGTSCIFRKSLSCKNETPIFLPNQRKKCGILWSCRQGDDLIARRSPDCAPCNTLPERNKKVSPFSEGGACQTHAVTEVRQGKKRSTIFSPPAL